MGARPKCQSWIEADDDGVGILWGRSLGGAHPQPFPKAHGVPIRQPDPFPVAILDAAQPGSGGDLGAQQGAETLDVAERIACRIEQCAYQRVAPQANFARLGFEYGFVAAIDESDGYGADVEERCLDGIRVETA